MGEIGLIALTQINSIKDNNIDITDRHNHAMVKQSVIEMMQKDNVDVSRADDVMDMIENVFTGETGD